MTLLIPSLIHKFYAVILLTKWKLANLKRLLCVLVILMLFLAGCGNIDGTVIEKKEASFIVETSSSGSESETQEIFLIDITDFSGAVSSFDELEVGQQVRVVPADLSSDFPYILASEVNVD